MSEGLVTKFHGSTLEVQTGYGAGKAITALTKADPAVATSTAHGLAVGAVGRLNDIDGMTELDDQLVVVGTVPTVNSISFLDVDSTGYGTFDASSPNDAEFAPVTFTEFCELTDFSKQGAAADQVEITTICSTRKRFMQGLGDTGTAELSYNWALGSLVQQALEDAATSGDEIAIRLRDEDGNMVILVGTVQQTSFSGGVGSPVYTGTASIKLSGEPYTILAS